MIDVEDAVKYFNNCKSKHLTRFSEKTPEGNYIKGWICRKPNRYLGSLLIDELNGESHEQFVQSMPKIEYFNDERDMNVWALQTGVAFEKLDGSCIILYPILEKIHDKDYIVEVVPKTRGRAVADKHFLELFSKIDKTPIWKYYTKHKGVLMFEMYGILNQHDIIHYQTGVDIALIGCYDDEYFYDAKELWRLSNKTLLKQPDEMFRVYPNQVVITTTKYKWFFDEVKSEDGIAPTRRDSIDKIIEFLEFLNKTYNDFYGRIATEGVVINCINSQGHQKYIKVKPKDIEAKHRSEKGVPRRDIVKECLKYFDEYGSEVYEIYTNDKNHHIEYLYRMLSEDYSDEIIQKSKKKIEKVFMQIWESKQVPQSIHNICDELYEEYGDEGITRCMQEFGKKYPMKKKDASTVYNVLNHKFKKQKSD